MPFAEHAGLRYFYFARLRDAGLVHGIFTRLGGVSPQPWGSLNAGSKVGDAPDRVAENLTRAAKVLGRAPASLAGVRQVHGKETVVVDRTPRAGQVDRRLADWEHGAGDVLAEADAVITQDPAATLMMRFADCVPILLLDPVRQAAGIAHAGWRGVASGVVPALIAAMRAAGLAPAAAAVGPGIGPCCFEVGIGPSICATHYQVGPEVVKAVEGAFEQAAPAMLEPSGDRALLDLWKANRMVLEEAGVREVEIAGECTAERSDLWFSHRAENGHTGRFAVLAGLAAGE